MQRRQKIYGFTLLEVLIALAIFSVMSMMAYGGLKTILNARNGTERAAERLTELQMAIILIQQDMQHMAPRSIRTEFYSMPREGALVVDSGLEYQIAFTRGGNNNPHRTHRSGLYRVGYQLEDGELRRLIWPTLDRAEGNVPQKMVLLHGVSEVAFSFLDTDWSSTWPPPAAQGLGEEDALPRAVEIVLVLDDWGTIKRLFATPY